MSKIPKSIANLLFIFSGEDYSIIELCSERVQRYFAYIGSFVISILICCFLSALYFTESLFHSAVADIGVGLIWGYIVTNLYVLLLYTISPTLLPTKKKSPELIERNKNDITGSLFLRIGMVLLLAAITAQPLNIFLFRPNSIQFATDIRELLASQPGPWIVTILIATIFVLPIYLKYNIRNLGKFYQRKAEIEQKMIAEDYSEFKTQFSEIFNKSMESYNQKIEQNLDPLLALVKQVNPEFYEKQKEEIAQELKIKPVEKFEYWADPPYRTKKRIIEKTLYSEQELLRQIYPED